MLSRSETTSTSGICNCRRLSTNVSRFGSGRPIDSNVLRPIISTCPLVVCLNHLKSSGKCQGIRFPAPITWLSDIAAMALNGFRGAHPVQALAHRQLTGAARGRGRSERNCGAPTTISFSQVLLSAWYCRPWAKLEPVEQSSPASKDSQFGFPTCIQPFLIYGIGLALQPGEMKVAWCHRQTNGFYHASYLTSDSQSPMFSSRKLALLVGDNMLDYPGES